MISLINNVQKVTGAQLSAAALLNTTVNYLREDFLCHDFDIYKYPNTLVSVPINGENLLKYLENKGRTITKHSQMI